MKRFSSISKWVVFIALPIFFFSCHKDNSSSGPSEKYQIVAGTWDQTDIVLAVPVSIPAGDMTYDLPAGTSVFTDPVLQAIGLSSLFEPTLENKYTFNTTGDYAIDGSTDFILPVAGNAGTWSLDVYDAVVKLVSPTNVNDPHWINTITSDSLSLSLNVNIDGFGEVPFNLLLKKQQ
jgi:hypothetical protein